MPNPIDPCLDDSSKYLIEVGHSTPTIERRPKGSATVAMRPIKRFLCFILQKVRFFFGEVFEWTFGGLTMLVLLALVAVVPILNFISLGYLVQMGANVAQTGKLKSGLVGIKKSAIFGRIAFGAWLVFWPIKFLFELKMAAELTDPNGQQAFIFKMLATILLFLTFLHIFWACLRGGKIRHFLWPAPIKFIKWLKTPHGFKNIYLSIKEYFSDLNLKPYFLLGFQAFFGALLWLIAPIGLMIFASFLPQQGWVVSISIPAGFLFMWVILHLPFLQIRQATEKRFKAIFEIKEVRKGFKRAPIMSWIALFITLLFALPLYLLKIELTPEEVAWLPSILFIFFIFPARLLVGWALYRSQKRESNSHWTFRWLTKFTVIPVLLGYAILVFITQYLSWYGSFSLLEQHAFLVPAPIMGL